MGQLLDSIDSPYDLKELDRQDLPRLAQEIRQVLIDTVSVTGGHLAPNLGAVELTLALHRVFDAPRDLIVWDVGHQAYVHKLLTGRRERFDTIRQLGGLSGFPKRSESDYDAFGVGHGSTSISAALGMAMAKRMDGRRDEVVAVIGDGAMTGGMAFEGLNQMGELEANMIVVLNDNGMSISQNVGALAHYLQKLRREPGYVKAKRGVEEFIQRYDSLGFGAHALDAARRIKRGAKHMLLAGMLFEDLGLNYSGPVDGHDIDALINALVSIKSIPGPRILHVTTQKGRGYAHAEQDAESFHGTKPFDVGSGRPNGKRGGQSFSGAFGDSLCRLADEDERVVAVTAAMRAGTGLSKFVGRHPKRFFDVGMAEEHAVTFAAGLATQGYRPVVVIYSTFMQRGYDQIIHDVCLQGLPVILCLDRAGIVGPDGPTHHGVFDLSYLRHIPGLIVAAPRDGDELDRMLAAALAGDKPFAIRYPAGPAGGDDENGHDRPIEVGRGELLCEGEDLTLLSIGTCAAAALSAAKTLSTEGVSAAVINARFVKPLDEALICEWAARTGAVLTIEDNVRQGGFGSAVLEMLRDRAASGASELASIIINRLGIPDEFVTHGSQSELRAQCGIDADGIADAARAMVLRRASRP